MSTKQPKHKKSNEKNHDKIYIYVWTINHDQAKNYTSTRRPRIVLNRV